MGMVHGPNMVTDGLVAYLDTANVQSYPGSGTTWYDLVGTSDGTLTNGPTFNSANGGSIVFDGSNDYVDIGDPGSSVIGTAGTFCFWLNPTSLVTNDWIWNKNNKSGGGTYNMAKLYSTNRIQFRLYGGWGWSGSVYTNSTDVLVTGTWSYITFRWYTNGLDVWKDGVVHDSAVESGTWGGGSTETIWLGYNNSNDGTGAWDGKIAMAQLYSTNLSAAQILQNYNAHKSRFGL